MNLTIKEISEYTGGKMPFACDKSSEENREEVIIKKCVIDSRKAEPGCLFVALKGENTDGHKYVDKAIENGAAAAIVESGRYSGTAANVIETENSMTAMRDIAAKIIEKRGDSLIRVAVTGSVGKTSTKDMVASVLGSHYVTLKSDANHNNELGLPMTVMQLENEHEVLVTEMGMRGLGQIEYLTRIVKPQIAVITNICVAHLEILGTRENILRAKLEICKGMPRHGKLILNADNDLLSDTALVREILSEYGAEDIEIIYFGTENNAAYRAENIYGSNYTLTTPFGRKFEMKLKVPGVHNVYNSMAAVCAANAVGISAEEAVDVLCSYGDNVSRQKIVNTSWGFVIDDTYNAGPESMTASLSVLKEMNADIKIAAIADMKELGSVEAEAHRKIGRIASETADILLAVGPLAVLYYEVFAGNKKFHAADSLEGADILSEIIKDCILKGLKIGILVKGSNAMKMNIVSERILNI